MKMLLILLLLFSLLVLVSCGGDVESYHNELSNTCPFGVVNDPAPGECGRYIDLNEDGLCDKGQQAEIAI